MDPGPPLGCSLKDVKWSAVAVPLDLLVSTYRLPQIARLDSGAWGGERGQAGAGLRAASGGGRSWGGLPDPRVHPLPSRGWREPGELRGSPEHFPQGPYTDICCYRVWVQGFHSGVGAWIRIRMSG